MVLLIGSCRAPSASGSAGAAELIEQGDALFDRRQYDDARAAYGYALVAADLEQNSARWSEAAAQLAHVHFSIGEANEGETWLERAWSYSDQGELDDATRARLRLVDGVSAMSAGDRSSALAAFESAFELAVRGRSWARAVQASHLASLQCEADQRVAWTRRGLESAASAREATWTASLTRVLARDLELAGHYDQAREAHRLARDHFKALGEPFVASQAHIGAARATRLAGRPMEAQAELTRAADEVEAVASELGQTRRLELLLDVQAEQAELALLRGEPQVALEHLRRALHLGQRLGLEQARPARWAELLLRRDVCSRAAGSRADS